MNYPPPSYLTGLVSDVSSVILSEVQKEYGDNTTAFKFKIKFDSLVQTWLQQFQHYGGTVWGIETTGNKILLFDQLKHGYNAMMKLNEVENVASTKSIALPQNTEIFIAFQYAGEEDEYGRGPSKFKQDYFSWVVIYKMIDNKPEKLFEHECA